jgi:hypothetical protein
MAPPLVTLQLTADTSGSASTLGPTQSCSSCAHPSQAKPEAQTECEWKCTVTVGRWRANASLFWRDAGRVDQPLFRLNTRANRQEHSRLLACDAFRHTATKMRMIVGLFNIGCGGVSLRHRAWAETARMLSRYLCCHGENWRREWESWKPIPLNPPMSRVSAPTLRQRSS